MITVEEKLDKFSIQILGKVNEDAKKKYQKALKESQKALEHEKEVALEKAADIINKAEKKAKAQKRQLISKAFMEKEKSVLLKQKEFFNRMAKRISSMAHEFTREDKYRQFFMHCVEKGISSFEDTGIVIRITLRDRKKYKSEIEEISGNYMQSESLVIEVADEEIIGGCIVENSQKTLRVDYSLAAMIDDNIENIGRELMRNLK